MSLFTHTVDDNINSQATLLAIEKRLNAVEFDCKRVSDSSKTINLLTGELERLGNEQSKFIMYFLNVAQE